MNRRDAIKAGGWFVAGAGVFGADSFGGMRNRGTGETRRDSPVRPEKKT